MLAARMTGMRTIYGPVFRGALAACAILACVVKTPRAEVHAPQNLATNPRGEANAYRRIFVPADNVAAWPHDGEKYLPIESREFEALVAAANRSAMRENHAATIVEAQYSARLEGDRLVAGRAEWTIELRGMARAFLPLGEMSILPREPRWRADHEIPRESKPAEPALLGMWGATGEVANEWGLEVARSGVIEFDWHAFSVAARDGISIEWKMPAANSTRLVLDLPEGKLPMIDGGVIVESRPLAESTSRDGGTRWRWELALADATATTLRIADVDGEATDATPELSLREDLAYRVTERGLEIEASLQFDEFVSELRELVVPLPPGVQLVSASCQNQELKWQVASTGSSDGTSALIAIPAEISATPLSITLSAWQPLSMNQPWQLPKLRPSGALWIAGNISVAVAPTLELQRLSTVGCQQSEVIQPVGNSNDFVSHSFAAYSANAAANISISSQKPDVTIRAVSSLALAETDVKGRLVTQVRVARGNLHQLSGDVAPGWSIEAVEANPPDSLGEWFVDRNDGRSEIEIQLNSAAEVTDDLTVIVTGRLQRTGLTQALAAETLRMVRWRDVRLEHHRLTFQTVEPYVVEPIGGLPVLKLQNAAADPPTISDASEESGPRFDLTAPAADAALRVTVKRGQYEADVWVDATVLDSELHQEFHVLARPRASHIDRLLIYSTQPLGDNLHWSERSSGIGLAAERITTGRRQQANVPQQGEAWLVRLPNPTGKPVEIVASQDLTWSVRKQLPLISVPEAVEQNGRVLVRGSVQRRPVADATELHAIPLPLPFEAMAESVQRWPVVAAYRYNPSDCLSSTDAPHLWIEPGGPTGFHGVIARRAEIESFFMLEGRAVHRVDYYLSSQGSRRLTVRLPDNATLRSLAVDGRRLVVPADGRRTEGEVGSAQSFPVSIPGGTD
jgi:hypothetical protein